MKYKDEGVNKNLQILWEMRDRAKDDEARKTAQSKIDDYFLANPKKKKKKRKKKKRTYMAEDEWVY
jgi:hypothetical protein